MRRNVFLLLLGFATACSDPDGGGSRGEPRRDITIDLDAPAAPVGNMAGWNLGRGTYYAPPNPPFHPEWRTPERIDAIRQLSELRQPGRVPWVRFSGLQIDGSLGNDGYHFADFVNPERSESPTDNMASFDYMALVEEAGAAPLVTVNYSSGTASEAAAYVTHLNGEKLEDPNVASRRHWGRESPYGVRRMEIGNEVYGFWNTGYGATGSYSYANPEALSGGDSGWHGRPAADPANYAARALEYVEKMSAADGGSAIRFWAPLSQSGMEDWGGIDVAVPALEPLLSDPRVEGVVIHQYLVDELALWGFPNRNDPNAILAGSELFKPGFIRLRGLLDSIDRIEPLNVVVTEYHVAGAFARGIYERGGQAITGLGIADMLMTYVDLGVSEVCQHLALAFEGADDPSRDQLVEPWYNPFRAEAGAALPNPTYHATRIVAEHLQAYLLAASVAQDDLAPPISLSGDGHSGEFNAIHAVATLGEDGGTLDVILLNRSLDKAIPVGIIPGEDGRVWQPVHAIHYAPPSFDMNMTATDVLPKSTDIPTWQTGWTAQLPPHSLTAFRFERGD